MSFIALDGFSSHGFSLASDVFAGVVTTTFQLGIVLVFVASWHCACVLSVLHSLRFVLCFPLTFGSLDVGVALQVLCCPVLHVANTDFVDVAI